MVAQIRATATFLCKFTGHPQPSIKWSKNNTEIKDGGRFCVLINEGFTRLEIVDLIKADEGNYRIDLENTAGSCWASAGLVVTGKC